MLNLDEEKDQCTTTKAKQEEERGPARGREQWEGEPGQACVGAWVVACVPRPSLVGSPGLTCGRHLHLQPGQWQAAAPGNLEAAAT